MSFYRVNRRKNSEVFSDLIPTIIIIIIPYINLKSTIGRRGTFIGDITNYTLLNIILLPLLYYGQRRYLRCILYTRGIALTFLCAQG